MGKTLDFIAGRYGIDLNQKRLPIHVEALDREALMKVCAELGFKVGAEIGVEQGKFSEVICKAIPGVRLYCVDAWKHYTGYRDHVNQEKLDDFYKKTEQRLAGHDAVLVRGFSSEVAPRFKRHSLDFVYIDANHSLPYVINDIWMWGDKVKPGGIIAGHDFIQYRRENIQCHVVEAVRAWADAYRIRPWFVLGPASRHPDPPSTGGTGRIGSARSWMWVKEK